MINEEHKMIKGKAGIAAIACGMYLLVNIANASETEGMYVGLGVSRINVELSVDNLGSVDISNNMLGILLGYQFNDYFSVEARGYSNLSDEDVGGVNVEVDHQFNALIRGGYLIAQYFKPYVLFGYGTSKLSVSGLSESDEDIVYGLGLSVNDGRPLHLEVEWQKSYDNKFDGYGLEADSFQANLVYYF